jgi:hypothetical protein
MNIIEFKSSTKSSVAFCLVDRTASIQSEWAKEIIKNISDFVISNIFHKKYDLYQGLDEDQLIRHVAQLGYKHAVVFSTGTEFIDGDSFFKNLEKIIKQDFFICGHVLDRKDAYYELHQQCYILNLELYKKINQPDVGNQQLGFSHKQTKPGRSTTNHHDDYTPKEVFKGKSKKLYNHACHGWNILKAGFEKNFPIIIFNEEFRNSKKHYYPESNIDFLKSTQWIYFRERYCALEMIHIRNTEQSFKIENLLDAIVIPASGTLWFDWLDPKVKSKVVFYDYNLNAIDYWKKHAPKKKNIKYEYIHSDLLADQTSFLNLIRQIPTDKNRLMISLSNIFCYEGTIALSPMSYRLYKENQLLEAIKDISPESYITFSSRASAGFIDAPCQGRAREFESIPLSLLKKPTWRFNQEWN